MIAKDFPRYRTNYLRRKKGLRDHDTNCGHWWLLTVIAAAYVIPVVRESAPGPRHRPDHVSARTASAAGAGVLSPGTAAVGRAAAGGQRLRRCLGRRLRRRRLAVVPVR